jgi:hypothetical protein
MLLPFSAPAKAGAQGRAALHHPGSCFRRSTRWKMIVNALAARRDLNVNDAMLLVGKD